MPPVFKGIVSVSVWLLFIKGLLAALATLYIASRALLAGDTLPMVAVAGCGVGSFAFILTCIAAWIRQKLG